MTAGAERRTVELADGRTLPVLVTGPPDGCTLLFHSGTPGGLVEIAPLFDIAATSGFRCVLYARPGYGSSSPRPGRLVADAAADVAAILDALGADRFVTAGWSGDGPHALATPPCSPSAAPLPPRSPGLPRTRHLAWTGSPVWQRRTSPSSVRPPTTQKS